MSLARSLELSVARLLLAIHLLCRRDCVQLGGQALRRGHSTWKAIVPAQRGRGKLASRCQTSLRKANTGHHRMGERPSKTKLDHSIARLNYQKRPHATKAARAR